MNIRRFVLYNTQFLGVACLFLAFAIHPLIHGTPLDSGMLDAFFTQLQVIGSGMLSGPSTLEEA